MNGESPINHYDLSQLQTNLKTQRTESSLCSVLSGYKMHHSDKTKIADMQHLLSKKLLQLRSFGTNSDNKSRNRNIFNDYEM